jgi:hypothetical protein
MKDIHYYATMPEARKSKGASKAWPRPFTRTTLQDYAQETPCYVECLAVDIESFVGRSGELMHECAGALQEGNDQAVCGSSCSRDYLRYRCVRISEGLARKLHPALLRYLES